MVLVRVSYSNSFDLISADTPFGQLKLNEIGAWLGRRNKNPRALVGAISRGKIIHSYPQCRILPYCTKKLTLTSMTLECKLNFTVPIFSQQMNCTSCVLLNSGMNYFHDGIHHWTLDQNSVLHITTRYWQHRITVFEYWNHTEKM